MTEETTVVVEIVDDVKVGSEETWSVYEITAAVELQTAVKELRPAFVTAKSEG